MSRIWPCLVLLCLFGSGVPAATDLAGPIRVIDGDTLDIGAVRVRLHGIDAPEAGQFCGGDGAPMWECGAWVTREIRARYDGRRAICEGLDRDRYGRVIARCHVDGVDLGRVLVQQGLAFAFRRYSLDYVSDEKAAALAGRGLHATDVASPAAFRAARRRATAARNRAGAVAGCLIKGNITGARYAQKLVTRDQAA